MGEGVVGRDVPSTGTGSRAELVMRVRHLGGEVWRRLAVLAAAPVVEGVVYSDGMTVDLGTPLDTGSRCTGALVDRSDLPDSSTSVGPVGFLHLLPATSTELAYSRVHGSAALQDRWSSAETDLLDLRRLSVGLD